MTGCYGYLYFSRDAIWYEVASKDKAHAFSEKRADLVSAGEWSKVKAAVEMKFRDGSTFHFFHVKPIVLETQPKFPGWDVVLPGADLIQAAMRFDEAVGAVAVAEPEPVRLPEPLPDVERPTPKQPCADGSLEVQLRQSETERDQIRKLLAAFGFENTMSDWLPEQNATDAAAMAVEAIKSLAPLDKMVADVKPADAAQVEDINVIAEALYDPIMRRWTPSQAQALAEMSSAERRALKTNSQRLRQLSQQSMDIRRQISQLPPCEASAPLLNDARTRSNDRENG